MFLLLFCKRRAIRRIPNHHVKAAVLHNLGKFHAPIKRLLARHRRVVNQRVAAFDMLIQRDEAVILLRRFQPQRELRDFHRFAVQIHAEQVMPQNRLCPALRVKRAGKIVIGKMLAACSE